MSRLQFSLRAYPPGTRVTKRMMQTDAQLRKLMDAEREQEIRTAQWIMRERGCTWGEALRLLRDGEATA